MKNALHWALIAIAMLSIVLLAGCSDRGGMIVSPSTGGITGRVTDGDGEGIAGINVITMDGTSMWETVTDENGDYALASVANGSRVIGFYGHGWTSAYLGVVVSGLPVTGNMTLSPSEGTLEGAPSIDLDDPDVSESAGTATISGQILNADVENAVIVVNGSATLISTDGSGNFSTTAILNPGDNTVYIWAVNRLGWSIAGPININFAPQGDLYFRVTLTWDGAGDIDLHNWDPNMAHSAYWNKVIPTGVLDLDNTDQDGPENFTCTALANGRFRVAVNNYSGGSRAATIRVSVFSGPNAGQTYAFGPYQLTQSNYEDGYPVTGNTASWWRPCDVLVNGSTISVVAPDGTALGAVDTMTRGAKK